MKSVFHPASICALALLIAPPVDARRAPAQPAAATYAVIIVVDGAPPSLLSATSLTNLRALSQRGTEYTNAFAGQEIADTPPAHATIGTGVFPRRHGVEGFDWKDPLTGAMTRPTDLAAVRAGALERVMEQQRAPSLAATLKSRFPRARVASVSGHKCYAADAMGTWAADYILCATIYHDRWVATAMGSHQPPPGAVNNPRFDVPIPAPSSGFAPAVEQWKLGQEDDWATRYALWIFHRVHYPRLLMINLPETDVLGHFTLNRATLGRVAAGINLNLGRIVAAYRAAGILDRTVFVVTSDHGMTWVRPRLAYSRIYGAIKATGTSPVSIEADTAASISLRNPGKSELVAKRLARVGAGVVDAALYKVHQGNRWRYRIAAAQKHVSSALRKAYLNLANTAASPSGPDVLLVYAPHVTTRDFGVGPYAWVAGHLGPQWDDQHIPLIVAGPGVRAGVTSEYPARLVDIAPTVAYLLGASMASSDGVVLADAMNHPRPADLTRQLRREQFLSKVVAALKTRSGY
jgi:hypothetical protein